MTAIKKYPGLHPHDNHEEQIREEKFRQKLKKKFRKTPQKHCKISTMRKSKEQPIESTRSTEQ